MMDLGLAKAGLGQVVEDHAPPSSYAIASFLLNEPGSFGRVLALTAIRTVFIIPGVWLAGKVVPGVRVRGLQHVAVASLVSTTLTASLTVLYLTKLLSEGPTSDDSPPTA